MTIVSVHKIIHAESEATTYVQKIYNTFIYDLLEIFKVMKRT